MIVEPAGSDSALDGESHPSGRIASKRWIAYLILGVVALASAFLAARGPAKAVNSIISWPAAEHEMLGPPPVGTPFLLTEREPMRLDVWIPCATLDGPSVGERESPVLITTARAPREVTGLVVLNEPSVISMWVGDDRLVEFPRPTAAEAGCELRIRFADERWEVSNGSVRLAAGAHTMPAMSGLFTDYPPSVAAAGGVRARFETHPQDSSPTAMQWSFNSIAAVAVLAMVALAFRALRRDRRPSGFRWRPSWKREWRAYDLAVVLTLGWWWLAASPLSDDGWVITTVANRRYSGTFSNYFDGFNAAYPIGFPFFGLMQAISSFTTSLLAFRLPALISLAVSWCLVRTIFDGESSTLDSHVPMTRALLCSTFLLGSVAAGMTLRPEPVVLMITMVVAVGVQEFLRQPSVDRLALPFLAASIALPVHTAGIVAFAPLALAVPTLWRLIRFGRDGELLGIVGLVTGAGAVSVMWMLADSDFFLWRRGFALMQLTRVHSGGPLNELQRYLLLFGPAWGQPLLRLAFCIQALVAIASLVRMVWERRRSGTSVVNRWAIVWLLGLLALMFVPSKWPVHLTTLAGLGASAVVSEARVILTRVPRQGLRWTPVAIGFVLAAASIAVATLVRPAALSWLGLGLVHRRALIDGTRWLGIALGLLVVATTIGCVLWVRRRGRKRLPNMGFPAVLVATVSAAAVVLVGAGYLIDSIVGRSSWSVLKQNLGLSMGSCGIAGSLEVGDPASLQPLPVGETEPPTRSVVGPYGLAAWPIDRRAEVTSTPWQALPAGGLDRILGLFVAGEAAPDPDAIFARVRVEVGYLVSGRWRTAGQSGWVKPVRFPWTREDRWSPLYFVPSAIAPNVKGPASVRLVVDSSERPLQVSGFGVVPTRPMDEVLRNGAVAATHVDFRPFLPCVKAPQIAAGVTEVPEMTILYQDSGLLGMTLFGRSSFFMLSDSLEFPPDPLPVRLRKGGAGPAGRTLGVVTVDRTRLANFEFDRS